MKATQKRTFRILVPRSGIYGFEVEAKSPELACKTLLKELRSGRRTEADSAGTLGPMWSDPSQKGDAWIVVPTSFSTGETEARVLGWNGKSLFDSQWPSIRVEDLSPISSRGKRAQKNQ